MVQKDIIQAARFHNTESRGIKYELRKSVIETFRWMEQNIAFRISNVDLPSDDGNQFVLY